MVRDWPGLKALALDMTLPEVTVDYPHGHECLKAFGKLWCHWSPYADGAVFKAERPEREMLIAADPDTFFLHPHYASYDYVLVRAGRIHPDWARARLLRRWRDNAPKRWLKAWDQAQGAV